ncbi:hypothetical protein M422DRAFT_272438 [Sphaerobolus stellatus SS14]|uniref:Uncharacterized protein n=1 Tax=Sphaerobolus stellatus (strain SS14) TaxID=990650 RepID=A0A0C9TBI3_SPHS4|nr:hypothetical protein M422DRAFT_272438 [Sphaerobolus stellatus SS14]
MIRDDAKHPLSAAGVECTTYMALCNQENAPYKGKSLVTGTSQSKSLVHAPTPAKTGESSQQRLDADLESYGQVREQVLPYDEAPPSNEPESGETAPPSGGATSTLHDESTMDIDQIHTSPLHDILHLYRLKPSDIETIHPTWGRPKWKAKHKISISTSKDEAIQDDVQDNVKYKAYSGRSAINGSVGAAAVPYKNRRKVATRRKKLGSIRKHMVYEAELAGAAMAAHMLKMQTTGHDTSRGLDNQAAIRASITDRAKPGQQFVITLNKRTSRVMPPNFSHDQMGTRTRRKRGK